MTIHQLIITSYIKYMAPELLNKIGNVGGKRGLCYGSKQVML